MAKIKVRRTTREELPGAAVLRDAAAAGLRSLPATRTLLDLDMELDPNLEHLVTHDPDGFFTALERDETLGFAAAHVRSRQWVLSHLWVLPQHQGKGAGEALLSRTLMYGERSGAREFLALVPAESSVQSLLLRHEMRPIAPVFMFRLAAEPASRMAATLARLLPGQDVTSDLMVRRGQADMDRIDRLARNITRELDHTYWLRTRGYRAAVVRQGSRIAAYAYGGADQTGPAYGTTQDAALCALGWAVSLSLQRSPGQAVDLRIPAPFVTAIDALHSSGARLEATLMLYGRGANPSLDRAVLGASFLP